MTAEDPIEFNLAGINQVQMKEQIGLNFAAALRSFLRQDPEHHPGRRDPRLRDRRDRDQGRADRAPRALDAAHERRSFDDQPPDEHGNRAVPRGDVGEPDLRAAARSPDLLDVLRRSRDAAAALIERRASPPTRSNRSRPVRRAGVRPMQEHRLQGTRRPLRSHADIDDEIREMILSGASAVELQAQGHRGGDAQAARMSGLQKIREGVTTIEEVLRETVL